jgi:hypothetical protein
MRNNMTAPMVMASLLALSPLPLPAQTPATPPPPASAVAPKIQFASNVFEFGKVPVGTVVRATFILTNTGNAPLEIKDVRPGCGCTTAGTWERRIEPGNTTTIGLQLNTANFGGALVKNATVTCNDPTQPTVTLLIRGEVWKPIDVQPNVVVFNPATGSGSNAARIVRVVNNTETMITLEAPTSSNPAFNPTLRTIKPGKEFELEIAVTPPLAAGTVQGLITAKTSSTNLPLISVTAMVVVPPALVTLPNRVMLPAGPLGNPTKITVVVRNNAGVSIALSEPSLTVSNATVQLSEVEAGRLFNLVLDFPTGFEMKSGERGNLSVKTSHPQTPVITVPILQAAAAPPRPALNLPPSGQ